MSNPIKEGYIEAVQKRYKQATTRAEKRAIIDEVMANVGIHRKSAIRALKRKPKKYTSIRKGKQTTYKDDLIKPLSTLWKTAGSPCSKRLVTQMGELIDKLKIFGEIRLYGNQEQLLRKMKTSTIDRLLEGERDLSKKEYGISGTKTSPLLKTIIPIRTNFTTDEYTEPGHIELDCVLHCGTSLSGIYAETLNLLDIATHWNEKIIFLHKTKAKIVGGVHILKKQFPFSIKSLDFDNGYEFVNWALKHYCDRYEIDYTRSRSYHKNDQAHIEGKNHHSVRKIVGYDRIDDQILVDLINDMYQHEHRLLTNFFYTTMQLKEKEKNRATGHVNKKYKVAKTPYQRVMESDKIPTETKKKLQAQYQTLNPAQLQRDLKKKLAKIYEIMKHKQLINSVTVTYHATPLPDYLFGNT